MATRKDYELVAKAINEQVALLQGDPISLHTVSCTAERLAKAFAEDNAAFKYATFITACGLPLKLRPDR